ncbi:MAG TPA: LamG domain-containing protein [Sedimentisphaerales bacterium]|nr:LamG domain-containing protein [Sedimentisphaerales bacterium]
MCRKMIYLVSFVLVLGLVLTSIAKADLASWWKLDEGSGTTASDASGNGNNGTLNGDPQWVAGKLGGALEFDGFSDGANHTTDPGNINWVSVDPFDVVGPGITLAAWIRPEGFDISDARIVTKQKTWSSSDIWWMLSTYTDGTALRMRLKTDDGGPDNGTTTMWSDAGYLEAGVWSHVAATYDGSEMRLYHNGVEIMSTNKTGTIQTDPTAAVAIGNGPLGDPGGLRATFHGLIDDLRIYNSALSEQELLGVMQGGGVSYPFASRPAPADGALYADIWVNLSWNPGDSAVSHDVYMGDNFDDVNDDDGTGATFRGNHGDAFIIAGFPGFAFPDGLVPGTTYYWRIDEVNDNEPNSPWKGTVWSFSIPPKTAYYPDPADAAESVDLDAELSWTLGFGAKLHTVYFGDNFEEVDNAAGGSPQGTTTYSPGTLKLAKTYYWRVDEFDIIETYKGDVWSFTTQGAVQSLDPLNGAVDVKQTAILTWSPSVYAASHEVYFGADKDAVKNADTGSPEHKGMRALGSESYDPGKLEWDTTYYWRIDEFNNANTDSPWTGPLWSFTTANFLIVDDFESYNDIDPPDPGSNRIFEAWPDGYEIPTNGALVGNDLPPYAEQSIVHSGIQSMPMTYDNAVGKSEATLTLTSNRDWTVNGINTLTIWFRGEAANAAENLYVALNGSAVVNHDNPDAALRSSWTQWNIDLQAFADQGVNLANVSSITLGLGNRSNPVAGGAGMMYFDDIRLYAPVR